MKAHPYPHHIFTQKQPFRDPDLEQLKILIAKSRIAEPQLNQHLIREQQYQLRIQQLERIVNELTNRLRQKGNCRIIKEKEHYQVVAELTAERERKMNDRHVYEQKIRALIQALEEANRANQTVKMADNRTSPSKKGSESKMIQPVHFRRTETPINELLEISQHFSPSQDEIHRLNSYLIENTTTLKLLLQKYNYLLKIRGISAPNDREELELISKTRRVLEGRKAAEEANPYLRGIRRGTFQDDGSSSQIEVQNSVIVEKEE